MQVNKFYPHFKLYQVKAGSLHKYNQEFYKSIEECELFISNNWPSKAQRPIQLAIQEYTDRYQAKIVKIIDL